ncbi:DUF4439 domain-containing protein [Propionibacteriaceae bacterium G1746]
MHANPPTRMGRRLLLSAVALGATGALAGCGRFIDPVVHGTNSITPPPAPRPDPEVVAAVAELGEHLALVTSTAVAAQPWAAGVAAMLNAHLEVLRSRDPLSGMATPEPWITPGPATLPAATGGPQAAVSASAAKLADAHAARADQASTPAEVLLWGSLSVATRLNAGPGPAAVAGALPRPVMFGSQVDARNVVLGHLHALAQLLEMGVGRLTGQARAAHETRLTQVRALVVGEQSMIRQLGGDPVAPLPGYSYPGPVGTDAQLGATWALVERQVFTAWGPVVATAAANARPGVLGLMLTQGAAVRARGLGTAYFPGWGA